MELEVGLCGVVGDPTENMGWEPLFPGDPARNKVVCGTLFQTSYRKYRVGSPFSKDPTENFLFPGNPRNKFMNP